MQETNDDQCLDYYVKIKISDDELREFLRKIGISKPNLLQKMKKEDRNQLLLAHKELEGVSIRQLSRITGIPKSVIHRIR